MAVECTADALAELAKCFTGISPQQQASITTYLLCQIANNGGGGGGGSAIWGDITGTLSNQADLQAALDAAAGTAVWGSITGTLSNQTDLQNALDAKLNLSGGQLTGNLTFSLDNTLDIGASGATRPRRGYFGTEVVSPLFTGPLTGNVTGSASLNVLKAGDTMTGALLFTDNTVDIGANGATRPRTGYFATSVITPLVTATTLAGTLSTAAQTNVTSLGTQAANLLFTDGTFDIGATGATRPRAGYFSTQLNIQRGAIGSTPTDALVLINSTAAAAGAQQYSGSLRFAGQGWKTNAVAASQLVEGRLYLQPVQGAAAPSANLLFDIAIGGGAFANIFSATAGNFITAGQIVSSGAIVAASSSLISLNGRGAIGSSAAGVLVLYSNTSATDFGRLQFGGTTSAFPSVKRSAALLQARLADDSAFTEVECSNVITNNAAAAVSTNTTLTNFAAAQVGTLTNAPTAGNPAKWIAIDDNGTTRYIPTWI